MELDKSGIDMIMRYQHLVLIVGMLICGALVSCAPSQTSKRTVSGQVVTSDKIVVKRSADAEAEATTIADPGDAEDMVATEIMDTIIWQIQTGPAPPPPVDPVIPEGQDPSLTEDALEAAFALLSSRVNPPASEPAFLLPQKAENQVRIGLLVPLSGQHAALGAEIRRGAEMALFKAAKDNVELLFLDTKAGVAAADAALTGAKNGVDIFVGPLFTDAVVAARVVAVQHQIPMLLLSNNRAIAAPDSWLMGYLPEQQLDGLLGHAVSSGKTHFGIVAQDAAFGQRLLAHATSRLRDFGLTPEAVRVLTDADLGDEDRLKQTIRDFTGYRPVAPDQPLADSPFDAVIFAGDPAFALRTAPLLAYYDVGPDRAMYLGNALWNQPQLLREPSLQGGLFAVRPSQFDTKFVTSWQDIWPQTPGELSRLGFDALALVAALSDVETADTSASKWSKRLVTSSGFKGYSGAFRLLPDGSNVRAFELRRIDNGKSKIIKAAPDKI